MRPSAKTLASGSELAVLLSGGLDSAVLLGDMLQRGHSVYPLYVRCGLRWEQAELAQVQRFLAAVATPGLQPLGILELPVADLYGDHWSLGGPDVPDGDSRDEAVFLPGRNVLLLGKALLWCHLHGVPALALGTLGGNPFADATDRFVAGLQRAVNLALDGSVRVHRPYAGLTKSEVMRRGQGLPLHLTFSCLAPASGVHCGRCNKCAERQRAFASVNVADPTVYATA
jgi:7-cyano-7-deazaguanine synthase